jgi:hypothetical protein
MRRASLGRVLCTVVPLGLAFLFIAADVRADERILSWQSDIRVRPDSTVEVRETLRVRAEGVDIRRGIFRDFPTVYTNSRGERVVTGFDVRSVARDGRAEPFRVEKRSNGVRIWIGDAAVELDPGEHTYILSYVSDRQLGYFADHDELYWNVTGNGWAFPIDEVGATVTLPAAVPADSIRVEAYTGPQGAKGREWTAGIDAGVATYRTTRGLGPGEGLTIVASWPKGHVAPPGAGRRAAYLFRDAWPALLAAAGLVLLILYYWRAWNAVGRDPPGRIVVPHYEAPKGESPASMRYLTRMAYDDRCFAAAVLALAVKGGLRIEQASKGLFGRKSEYTLHRTDRRRKLSPGTNGRCATSCSRRAERGLVTKSRADPVARTQSRGDAQEATHAVILPHQRRLACRRHRPQPSPRRGRRAAGGDPGRVRPQLVVPHAHRLGRDRRGPAGTARKWRLRQAAQGAHRRRSRLDGSRRGLPPVPRRRRG